MPSSIACLMVAGILTSRRITSTSFNWTNSASALGFRIVATTFQPFPAKHFAAARPMPDDVPVIKIVFFISSHYSLKLFLPSDFRLGS